MYKDKDAIVSALCGEGFCVENDRGMAMELLREVCGERGIRILKNVHIEYDDFITFDAYKQLLYVGVNASYEQIKRSIQSLYIV